MRDVLAKQPVISIQFPRLRVWKSEKKWQRERNEIASRYEDAPDAAFDGMRLELRRAAARHIERCQGRG